MGEKPEVKPITFTVDGGLLEEFDKAVATAYYPTRSAALSAAMRDFIRKVKRGR